MFIKVTRKDQCRNQKAEVESIHYISKEPKEQIYLAWCREWV